MDPCGRSEATYQKEAGFSTCIGFTLKAAPLTNGRYCVFDLNAGRPENMIGDSRCRGTTRVVLDKLRKRRILGALWWCDKNREVIADLRREAAGSGAYTESLFDAAIPPLLISVVHGDNRAFAPMIPDQIRTIGQEPRHTRGVIIADPNGLKVPLAGIAEALAQAPMLDVAIHLYAFMHVWSDRDRNGATRTSFPETDATVNCFRDVFTRLPKARWLISEVIPVGRGHIILYGTHLRAMRPLALPGRVPMHLIDSPEGRALLARIERRTVIERFA